MKIDEPGAEGRVVRGCFNVSCEELFSVYPPFQWPDHAVLLVLLNLLHCCRLEPQARSGNEPVSLTSLP